MKPLVSAITPSFRMQKYLKTFLEWLPRQTFFHQLEVVLDHNEPSTEEVQLVRAFQKQYPGRLKHIVVEKVDPIGTSMNRCIRESAGDYLTIWNIDDLRTDDSIEKQARLLEQRLDIGLVYGNFKTVKAFGRTEGTLIDHSRLTEDELTRGMIVGPFFMFRKSLIQKAGYFDEQLKQGPDFDLAVRLAFHTKAAMTPGLLGYYLNENLGASTRPGTLQPVEAAVIELRYGIYDKIDYPQVANASRYNIPFIRYQNTWLSVSDFVPSYDALLAKRYEQWHEKGLRRFHRQSGMAYQGALRLKQMAKKALRRA
jgi:glycosyltransferase involved in cell wall biosynthesis